MDPTTNKNETSTSPNWGPSTKLVVGLSVVAFAAALLIYFRQIIGPLVLAFILAYVFFPLVSRLKEWLHISWRTAVNIIYLLLIIILGGLSTLTGLAVVQQIQSLISFVEGFVNDLPELVESLTTQEYTIGPIPIDFSQFDLTALAEQLLQSLQPLLGQAGSIVTQVAASAATSVGWGLFVLLISYFLLSESGRFPGSLVRIDIPGYNNDIHRLGNQLGTVWNSFLRGQLILSFLIIISYYVLLNILGTRAALAISLMAGLARFIPYLGPLVTWIVTAIVAFVQTGNYFGLEPYQYALLVLVACLLLDQIFDNLIGPRILGETLGVHPAGVLIAAIIVARLIGIIGLILAAPTLATVNILGRYILRKMFDQEPWPETDETPAGGYVSWRQMYGRLNSWWGKFTEKRRNQKPEE